MVGGNLLLFATVPYIMDPYANRIAFRKFNELPFLGETTLKFGGEIRIGSEESDQIERAAYVSYSYCGLLSNQKVSLRLMGIRLRGGYRHLYRTTAQSRSGSVRSRSITSRMCLIISQAF